LAQAHVSVPEGDCGAGRSIGPLLVATAVAAGDPVVTVVVDDGESPLHAAVNVTATAATDNSSNNLTMRELIQDLPVSGRE
jgi:hypothetical protein